MLKILSISAFIIFGSVTHVGQATERPMLNPKERSVSTTSTAAQGAIPNSPSTAALKTAASALSSPKADEPRATNYTINLALQLNQELTEPQIASIKTYGHWFNADGLSVNAQQLIRAIQDSSVHGLNPESYLLTPILQAIDTLNQLEQSAPNPLDPKSVARRSDVEKLRQDLSSKMQRSFLLLAKQLGTGVVEPRITQKELFRDAPTVDAQSLLASVEKGEQSVSQALSLVTQKHPQYQRLTRHMRGLLTERASGIKRPIVSVSGGHKTSMSPLDVMNLKYRLMEIGELPMSTELTPIFDETVSSALKWFQKRNGLTQTGFVDTNTRKALNLSIDEEIQAVALSLERWRWMPRELGKRYLFINIPTYEMQVYENDEIKFSMATVIGAVKTQTPAFSRDLSYMEFNPTWTVPKSITNNELIPKERRQPGFLESKKFIFLKKVNNRLVPISRDKVNAKDFDTRPFPYTLQQAAGPGNELGKMKFMMPNPYAIYLHDTPAKSDFSRNMRAASHGCLRLSEPAALATFLMSEDGYSAGEIQRYLSTKKTTRVPLRSPLPTHLTYMTTWIDNSGVLQRRADIYQQDAALISALYKNGTLLSVLNHPSASVTQMNQLAGAPD